MQHHVPNDQWHKTGCFVYKVLRPNPIGARFYMNVGDEYRNGLVFKPDDLVSVDLIRPSRFKGSQNGPFLRLSDGHGWLFEYKYSEKLMERLTVKTGLWAFYVDNYPAGISLRRHPFDNSPRVEPNVVYKPMQLIYCDTVVTGTDGTNFYRVQGTEGWVFDRRGSTTMLLPESQVKTGIFAYEATALIAIRNRHSTGDAYRTSKSVKEKELVCADIILQTEDDLGHNGPFIQLTDGSGWLFERKDSRTMLRPILVKAGRWTLVVINSPAGICLRAQPIDSLHVREAKEFRPHEAVICDRKITNSSGVNFYRVEGTTGWVFDKRGDRVMMKVLATVHDPQQPVGQLWSIDFLRGAAMASGLDEIYYNPESRIISFANENRDRINVYYTTGTIGTALDHPHQGKTQLFRKNCSSSELLEIFQNPRIHTGRGYKKRSVSQTPQGPGVVLEEEEDLRNSVVNLCKEMEKMEEKKIKLLKSIKHFDDRRAAASMEMEKKRIKHAQEEEAKIMARKIKEEEERRAKQQKEEEERRRVRRIQELTCNDCYRVFSSDNALSQHRRDAHFHMCEYCGKYFKDYHALEQHCDATNHW